MRWLQDQNVSNYDCQRGSIFRLKGQTHCLQSTGFLKYVFLLLFYWLFSFQNWNLRTEITNDPGISLNKARISFLLPLKGHRLGIRWRVFFTQWNFRRDLDFFRFPTCPCVLIIQQNKDTEKLICDVHVNPYHCSFRLFQIFSWCIYRNSVINNFI